jgi:hypothetical protein
LGNNYAGYMGYITANIGSATGTIIGTGTTPPALDDYCLSGTMITAFTSSSNISKGSDEQGDYLEALHTITNTGSEPFTIGEIGLVGRSSNATNASSRFLFERTVLDEPVTIPAGGVGQVTHKIRMIFPVA